MTALKTAIVTLVLLIALVAGLALAIGHAFSGVQAPSKGEAGLVVEPSFSL